MKEWIKRHKRLIIVFSLLAAAAIAWAATSGQANSLAADAGSNSANMEMASLDMVEPPKKEKAPNCDWQLEKQLRKQIAANDKEYKNWVDTAKGEVNSAGAVSDATAAKVRGLAAEFRALNQEYADMWQACDCHTRAQVALDAGETRVKSAEVVVSEIDQSKLDELKASQNRLRQSRRAYVEKANANNELTPQQRQRIRARVRPRADMLVMNLTRLVGDVVQLINELRAGANAVSSGSPMGMAGCAAQAVTTGELPLITHVQSLLALVESLLSNAEDLVVDVNLISG